MDSRPNSGNELQNFMIIAGEPSGDMHGAELVRLLKARQPGSAVFGVGGEMMKNEGFEVLVPLEKMAILGFVEVVKHLPFIRRVFKILLSEVERRRPKAVILIDYPGFNIRFAGMIRKRFGEDIRIFYYISPQVWAWKKRRIHTLAKTVDAVAVVFPFEEELYLSVGAPVKFVGHPLVEKVRPSKSREEFYDSAGLDPDKPVVGLLPGSRMQEVERHLPHMLGALRILRRDFPGIQAVIGKTPYIAEKQYSELMDRFDVQPAVSEEIYNIMHHSDVLVVSSGTATLESGLSGTPMVIIYRMSPLSYVIARLVVTLKFVGLVNIVHGGKIVPELIQNDASPENIAAETAAFLNDSAMSGSVRQKLESTRTLLGEPGAAQRAVDFFMEKLP